MKATCPYCCHIWDYKGSSKFYVTCPVCYYKIGLNRAIGIKRKGEKT